MKEKKQKLLLQISVRELHSDLMKPVNQNGFQHALDKNNKPLISDTALRYLLPPELRKMTTRHKIMCGCEPCLSASTLQESLNAWRRRYLKQLDTAHRNKGTRQSKSAYESYKSSILHNNKLIHERAKDAALSTMCPFLDPALDLPHWCCVLQCCKDCPSLFIPPQEQESSSSVPTISYHVYKTVATCSIHGQRPFGEIQDCTECLKESNKMLQGNLSKRKHLVLLNNSISKFHKKYYKAAIHRLAFHLPHVMILGKNHCAKLRREAFEERVKDNFDICCERDYAERFVLKPGIEVQSQHFGGNRSLSIERVSCSHRNCSDEDFTSFVNEFFFSFIR